MNRHVAALVAALVALSPAYSGAQGTPDEQAQEQTKTDAKAHFSKGRELYDSGDKQGAVEEFKEAFKLSRNPFLLYNIALVYDELHDKSLALHYYKKFVDTAPADAKSKENRALAGDRINVLTKEIAADEEAPASAPTTQQTEAPAEVKPGPTRRANQVTAFTHVVVEESPPGRPLDVTAKIPEDSDLRLTLYYRPAGEDQFKVVKMKSRYDELVGRIPPNGVRGESLQYYIEVKDANGKLVASSGRASSPNVVYLEASAKPHYYEELAEGGSGTMVGEDDLEDSDPLQTLPAQGRDESRAMTYAKWATTGSAAAFLTSALIFYLKASSNSSELEGIAHDSAFPPGRVCANQSSPPCTQFSDSHKWLEEDGGTFETWTNVTLVIGVASAAAAGVLWYLDIKQQPHLAHTAQRQSPVQLFGAPVVGSDIIGGAAVMTW